MTAILTTNGQANSIELPDCHPIRILYEDRTAIAVDKPPGWMLVPHTWQRTARNLQAAITSSIAGGDYWAKSRGLKFLRYVHRLDADTSGVLLFGKSLGAVESLGDMFESRLMEKTYLCVTAVEPREMEWTCRLALAPDPLRIARMIVDEREGKGSETHFRVLEKIPGLTLVEARPVTGRTHQIRVHMAESGYPIVSDELYGRQIGKLEFGLRAVRLAYRDPFTKKPVEILAGTKYFLRDYGFTFVPAPHKEERAAPARRPHDPKLDQKTKSATDQSA
jgi:23S rRNA pseudouridine1911/1915/1917 synthase